jgi:hypothetical protein
MHAFSERGTHASSRLDRPDSATTGPGHRVDERSAQEPASVHEREADRVAQHVFATPGGLHPVASRIQRLAGPSPSSVSEAPAHVDLALTVSGAPLQPALRLDMEQRFGQDFSAVRVHDGAAAKRSAQAAHARAYTVGHDIVFGAGMFSPMAPDGRRLIAHELAHVVQQASRPVLQRKPDDSAGSVGPSEFDPATERQSRLATLESDIDFADPKEAADLLRVKLLFQASTPDWPDLAALDTFYDECLKIAESEQDTIAALGDPDRTEPDAFPETWSERLKQHLTMSYPMGQVRRDVDAALAQLQETGGGIPKEIFNDGLPVDFPTSLGLRDFRLASMLGMGFTWSTTPDGNLTAVPGPLAAFTARASRYLNALNEADFISLWIEYAASVAAQVLDGEFSVDPDAFEHYQKKRPNGVPPDEVKSATAEFPAALAGRIDPAEAERHVTSLAGLVTFGRSVVHGNDVAALADRFLGQADSLVAGEAPPLRQMRASRWGHEHGFYSSAIGRQWEDIKEHAAEIAGGMAKDVALFTVLEFIPVVNIITTVYLGAQLIMDVADTVGDLASADEEARDAKTAVALQRGAAHQAAALSAAARKVAEAVVMHQASKVARAGATKVKDWATKGEPAGTPSEPTRGPEDPAKVQERARQKEAEAKKKTEREAEAERKPDELTQDLPRDGKAKGGEARVTAEGHCKICHSPCRFQVDMARDVLRAVEGTRFAGYAENLAMRIRLLDDAMEASSGRGTLKAEYPTRFAAAHRKLAAEIDAAHGVFVDRVQGTRHAAAEEIQRWEAEREHGFMDDPNRFRRSPERAREGTAFHDHIEAAVVDALPAGTIFTESTVQGLFQRMGVDPNKVPAKSTGLDLYVIDRTRGVVTPVDIIGVAGGKSHVQKLHEDVARVRDAFEQVGLHMTEPIEIEYVGMTFKEAAAGVAAELRAFAR